MNKIKLITGAVGEEVIQAIEKATSIYILTSFVMKSGVDFLVPYLKKAIDKGAEVKLLTGDYLYVTQPEGLRKLTEIDQRIEVRLWQSNGRSFHPKAYLFEESQNEGTLIVGSSNLSRSALTHGIEWNLIMDASVEPVTFEEAKNKFMQLYLHEQTIPVNEETIKVYEEQYDRNHQQNPNLVRVWTETEEKELMLPKGEPENEADVVHETQETYIELTPRPAQRQALEALETTVSEGYTKAMVVMATGIGDQLLFWFRWLSRNINEGAVILQSELLCLINNNPSQLNDSCYMRYYCITEKTHVIYF
ncbi:phospholipase D-like domain-containing protein [Anaerobacillus sp. MEB173]|uniref:phospholipase D-like domain-containing protein n=1 Tax=Anaerobacillus sp. MEB173 TaxID=3383345 RepID=UPI003F8E4149